MHAVLEAIQDLLFPPLCVGCSRRLDHSRPPLLCTGCLTKLHFISSPICPCCGIPYATGADHLCSACLQNKYDFDLARSLLRYQPPTDSVILRLKFGAELSGLRTLAALLAESCCLREFSPPDYLIPIPLHATRIRERGFNQATLIARSCFPQWQGKLGLDILIKKHQTPHQTQLSGQERRSNLKQAFSLNPHGEIFGKTFLLVDDVLTTGSTVNACARLLRRGGAKRIEVFTLARSLGKHAW